MKVIEIVLRILLGGLFLYAGAIKIVDPGKFLLAVRSYEIVGDPWAAWVALSLPWIEVLAGACVLLRILYRGALTVLVAAILLFLIGIAAAWARGLDIECGCFGGEGFTGNYAEIIFRDFLLLGTGLFLFFRATASATMDGAEAEAGAVRG